MLAVEDGVTAVRLARQALERALRPHPEGPSSIEESGVPHSLTFEEPRGVFVTLKRYPSGTLRGCIGYPLPVLPLRAAVGGAAVSAATQDYRFRPVTAQELSRITIEVSVLTVPEVVHFSTPEEAIRSVKVGRDGLIVEGFGSSGLLLPQVAPEEGWSAKELLDGTCEKAGLPRDAWRDPRVTVRRFEAQIFHELAPAGEVVPAGPTEAIAAGRTARRT